MGKSRTRFWPKRNKYGLTSMPQYSCYVNVMSVAMAMKGHMKDEWITTVSFFNLKILRKPLGRWHSHPPWASASPLPNQLPVLRSFSLIVSTYQSGIFCLSLVHVLPKREQWTMRFLWNSHINVFMYLFVGLFVFHFLLFYFYLFIYFLIDWLIGWFSDKTFKDGIWAADSRHAQATTWPFMLLRKDMNGRWLELTSERVLSLPNSNDFCGNLEWPQHN